MSNVAENAIGFLIFVGICYCVYRFIYLPRKAKASGSSGSGGGTGPRKETHVEK